LPALSAKPVSADHEYRILDVFHLLSAHDVSQNLIWELLAWKSGSTF